MTVMMYKWLNPIELQTMAQVHESPNTDTDKEDELSSNDSHGV